MANHSKNIYIVFLSTRSKMGSFIRLISQNKYNHVSISLDDDLHKMYSFARYYKNSPFFGGFVGESILRYCEPGREAELKIIKIRMSTSRYDSLVEYIKSMENDSASYVYNTLSAVFTPMHRKVSIKNAYTCIEFIIHLLCRCQVIDKDMEYKYHSIRDLENMLSRYTVFQGPVTEIARPVGWEADMFCQNKGLVHVMLYTLRNFGRLAYRKMIL